MIVQKLAAKTLKETQILTFDSTNIQGSRSTFLFLDKNTIKPHFRKMNSTYCFWSLSVHDIKVLKQIF